MKILALFMIVFALGHEYHIKDEPRGLTLNVEGINWPFSVCGKGKWTIESVIFASIPSRSTSDNIDMSGTATDTVKFKRVDLDVKLNNVFLHNESQAFAATFDEGDAVSYRYTNYIPNFAPPGTYLLTFQFINQQDEPEGCISFSFKL